MHQAKRQADLESEWSIEEGEGQLLKAAQTGDDEAFGQLIRPYLDPAYRLAVRVLDNPTNAEDAVQDALLKAWRALPSFRGRSKFSTWLYRIVWNVCVDRTRRKESLPWDGKTEQADCRITHQPEESLEARESQAEIERALRQLSLPYRTVLTLYYIEDIPVRDIAAILDLPVGTVKTHLHRARRALREVMIRDAARKE